MHRWYVLALPLLLAFPAFGEDASEKWICQRVDQVKNSESQAWRTIPWASSLTEARRQSELQKRPVFVFTHDGNIETGRC